MAKLAAEEFEHERLAREAADDGAQVHALIEWRMRKALGQITPRVLPPGQCNCYVKSA